MNHIGDLTNMVKIKTGPMFPNTEPETYPKGGYFKCDPLSHISLYHPWCSHASGTPVPLAVFFILFFNPLQFVMLCAGAKSSSLQTILSAPTK